MRIWQKDYTLDNLQPRAMPSMADHLGIEVIDIGDDYLTMRMPVDDRTRQPRGLLHGGASCVLAETVGSVASFLCVDAEKYVVAGLEINANHVRGISEGYVVGTARPLHIGRSTHVWDIRIEAEATKKLICVSRLTVAVLER
ncbi:hotdog fold thioesterase [Candidatus Paracaedibacter symbiosus]|uniref:hotdog fold thioesterase n=1 Tax=Candidatus Paracaedibacter symbiosus TaxID=244582 RepID=UPI0005097BD5|nr:hotdog fold thioesterase [Candidatus Paracaedibacter symbiosus]